MDSVDLTPRHYNLLLFLEDRTASGTWEPGADLQEFVDEGNFDMTAARWMTNELVKKGFAALGSESGNVTITAAGMQHLTRASKLRQDLPARARHVRGLFLHTIYALQHSGSGDASFHLLWHELDIADMSDIGLTLGRVYSSERLYAYGEYVLGSELVQISRYLEEKGLLARWPGAKWPDTKVVLTSEGIDCVESGLPVHEFEKKVAGSAPATYVTQIADAQGVIIGQQSNFTQHNHEGFDPTQIASFASLVRQISPTLGLKPDPQAELERQALDLHTEATSNAADRGRMRKLVDAVLSGLSNAAPTVASQIAIGVGQDALRALGH